MIWRKKEWLEICCIRKQILRRSFCVFVETKQNKTNPKVEDTKNEQSSSLCRSIWTAPMNTILWAIQSADEKANSNKTYKTTVRIHGNREGRDLLIILSNSAEISSHMHCLPFMKTEKLCGNTEDENIKQYVGIRRDTKKCYQDTSDLMDATKLSGKNIH